MAAPGHRSAPPHRAARPLWSELPAEVRDAVASVLGSPITAARSQQGGFSPGSADRVVTADGRRAFVKAVSTGHNPHTPGLHRRERRVLQDLSGLGVAPAVLGVHDDGEWVALVLEDVAGRHPAHPWQPADTQAVLAALAHVAGTQAPAGWPALEEELAGEFSCWSRLAADPPPGTDPWVLRRSGRLGALAAATLPRLAGGAVVHTDLRSDNVLVTPGQGARVVDWPWAARGAPWFDTVCLLVDVRWHGGDVAPVLEAGRALGAGEDDVLGAVAGLGGFFLWQGSRPPEPGLPTLRTFQLAQGRVCLQLLREWDP